MMTNFLDSPELSLCAPKIYFAFEACPCACSTARCFPNLKYPSSSSEQQESKASETPKTTLQPLQHPPSDPTPARKEKKSRDSPASPPPPLPPHTKITKGGVEWKLLSEKDKQAIHDGLPKVYSEPTRLNLNFPHDVPRSADNEEMLFFRALFPLDRIPPILEATNAGLDEKMTEAELWVFLALILAMSLSPLHEMDEHWKEYHPEDVFSGQDFGRFMERKRFHAILAALRLDDFTPAAEKVREACCVDLFFFISLSLRRKEGENEREKEEKKLGF